MKEKEEVSEIPNAGEAAPLTWEALEGAVEAGRESPFDTQGEKAIADALKAANDVMGPLDFSQAAGLNPNEPVRSKHVAWVVVNAAVATLRSVGQDLALMHGAFHLFTGTHWRHVETALVRIFLVEAALMFGLRRTDASYHRFVADLEKQAATELVIVPREQHDAAPLINYLNGTLEFRDGTATLRPHRKSDHLQYAIDCDYAPEAESPKFSAYLHHVVPDEPSQLNLAEFIGSLFYPLRHEMALFCVGPAGTGKSVFFEVTSGVIGPHNVTHFSLESLSGPANRAMLAGKLLNYASELGKGMNSEVFKKIVSGEPVEARLLYQNPIIIRRLPRLAFNCNELPRDIEITDAFFRRLLIILFDQRIDAERRVPDLAAQIVREERAGVMNWIIAGLQRLIELQGFTPNPKVEIAVAEYRLDADSLAAFLHEKGFYRTDGKNGQCIGVDDLYRNYTIFCARAGFKPLQRSNMARRLLDLGYIKKKRNHATVFFMFSDDPYATDPSPF